MHKDVAQSGHLARQGFAVFLFAHVDPAVLQQDQFARLNRNALGPVRHHRNGAAHQLAQARSDRRQRVFRLEAALGWATQMAGDHDGRSSVQSHADTGYRCADARVLGDGAIGVLGHIQVSADEDSFAAHLAAGAQVGET